MHNTTFGLAQWWKSDETVLQLNVDTGHFAIIRSTMNSLVFQSTLKSNIKTICLTAKVWSKLDHATEQWSTAHQQICY